MLGPLSNYPFKTARVLDGKTYITVDELNEILDNLEKLGPVFQQIAVAAKGVGDAFRGASRNSGLIVEDLKRAEGNL